MATRLLLSEPADQFVCILKTGLSEALERSRDSTAPWILTAVSVLQLVLPVGSSVLVFSARSDCANGRPDAAEASTRNILHRDSLRRSNSPAVVSFTSAPLVLLRGFPCQIRTLTSLLTENAYTVPNHCLLVRIA
jgi:hypothetical protein